MAKKFEVEVEVPEGAKAGDIIKVEVEVPAGTRTNVGGGKRGQLAGLALEDMSDEQLKREIINASSVLYKATQRGADQATIDANQVRLDAAKAEKEKRAGVKITATAEEAAPADGEVATTTDEAAATEDTGKGKGKGKKKDEAEQLPEDAKAEM